MILPGVGSFESVVLNLKKKELYELIDSFALKMKRPVLGICLGMHLMMESSEEAKKQCNGFGWFKGKVKINKNINKDPLNVGWDFISPSKKNNINDSILRNILKEAYYFDHSYSLDVQSEGIIAKVRKKKIPSIIFKNNLIGVQFHPEKSQKTGHEFVNSFLTMFKLI